MIKNMFNRPAWTLALCLAAALPAALAAQPESLVSGPNRNVAATASPAPLGSQGEVQVAVNPNNPNQLVAVAETNTHWTGTCDEPVAVYYSANGGATWQTACAPGSLAYTGIGDCYGFFDYGWDPVVVWDDNNQVFLNHTMVCSDGRITYGTAIVTARSTDGGASWTAHGVVSESDFFYKLYSSHMVDNSPASPFHGRHYSCWSLEGDGKISYSTDGGATWTQVDLPSPLAGSFDGACEMAVEDDGTLHVVLDSSGMFHTRSTDGGLTWSAPVLVRSFNMSAASGGTCPYAQNQRCIRRFGAIAVDNSGGACDGRLYAVFTDHAPGGNVNQSDIFLSRSVDGGATWSAPVKVNDDGLPNRVQFQGAVQVDPSNGQVVVAWRDARNHVLNDATDVFTARSTDCGVTFKANVQASQPSAEFNNSGISWSNHSTFTNPNAYPDQTGNYMGLDVRGGKAYLAWPDTRHFFPSFTTEPQKENIAFTVVDFAAGAASVCGNNAREAGEACDGMDLGGKTCASLTFTGGSLACKPNCAFDTSGCYVTLTTTTFTSVAAEDGYILESGEFTSVGGTANSTDNSTSAIRLGDDRKDKQFTSILSFDTSPVPDGAVIQSITLRLRRGTVVGTNPLTTHGQVNADIRNGGFNGNVALETADFQASATAFSVCVLSNAANNGDWSECNLNTAALVALNKTGKTQIRIALSTDDNDDGGDDYIGYYSSNNATAANHPQLIVTYQ
jgi:BNR repeat-like domain